MELIVVLFLWLFVIALFLLPFIIAFARGHNYKWIILILCFVPVFGWFVAFIWAVWPSHKSIIDPIVGNPTGTGHRNVGDTIGSAKAGIKRGEQEELNNKI
jgi:hypothetical protein